MLPCDNAVTLQQIKNNIMKRITLFSLLVIATALVGNLYGQTTPAFPGAEGFARYTTSGGRGGDVYHVTNLNDSGTGSFREGLKKGNRTIVFDVSGTITLESTLKVNHPNTTIAGQTAPGEGITLRKYPLQISADNVIVRFIRCRLGNEATLEYLNNLPANATDKDKENAPADDAMWGKEHSNIIIDHCSMSWSVDECSSFYDNTNFTMQWCIIGESLANAGHPKGSHGYGGIWGGKGASFHHNLLANHNSRNPRFCGSRYSNKPEEELIDMRNNVISNWGSTNSGYAAEGGSYNLVNNYYKSGPATKKNVQYRIFQPGADDGTNAQAKGVYGIFYVNGNYMSGKGNNWDWDGIDIDNRNNSEMTKEKVKSATEFEVQPVSTHTAEDTYTKVCLYAGASYKRDAVDTRIVRGVETGEYTFGQGIIDTQDNVGGWPVLESLSKPTDSNNDGIPDEWAAKYLPQGKTYRSIDEETGYSYLELYINSLVDELMKAGYEQAESSPSKDDFGLKGTTTGMEEQVSSSTLSLHKTGDKIVISGLEGKSTVEVYDLTGRLLESQVGYDSRQELSLLQPAIVRITDSRQTKSFKVL